MSIKHTLLAFAVLSFTFTSCKEDDEPEEMIPEPTKTELLTGKFWDLISETQSIDGGPDVELLVNEEACDADDLIYFFTNHVFQETDGALSCDSLNPFFWETTWAFNAAQDSLILDGEISFFIDNLTSTELRLRELEMNLSGSYVNNYTFEAQK